MHTSSPRLRVRHALLAVALVTAASVSGVLVRSAEAATPTVATRVDRTAIALGETLVLTLTSEGSGRAAAPDLTALDADFDVLATGSGTSTSIVNGRRTDSSSWNVTLSPKTSGTLTIPALRVGAATSRAIEIDVTPSAPASNGAAAPAGVEMRVVIEAGSHHVHEEIPLTLIISDALGLHDASLSEPSGADFVLTHTGEDRTRAVTGRDGEIRVTERHYLLRPRHGGSIEIPSMTLQGRVPDRSARRSPFGDAGFASAFGGSMAGLSGRDPLAAFFDRGRSLSVRSAPLTIDVLDAPIEAGKWFLPAKRVELQEDWGREAPTFREGEAVTRTIRIVALGAALEQLPDLRIADADGVRLYADRTRDRTVDTADGIAAVREIDVSIVPTRAGEITLPSIDVPWWDTDADVERTASLPARTLDVQAVGGPGASVAPGANPAAAASDADAVTSSGARGGTEHAAAAASDTPVGAVFAASVALLSALAGVGRWLWRRRVSRATREAREAPILERDLASACRDDDPERAYRICLEWLRATRSSGGRERAFIDRARTTDATAALVDPRFDAAFHTLESHLFSAGTTARWDGAELLATIPALRRARSDGQRRERRRYRVPELYPA